MSPSRLNRAVEALAQARRARLALPRNVRALSWVSFANDAASELAYPVVPLFLTVTLGAPVAAVGVIEGVAEGIAVGLRGLAGWLSDRWGERRLPRAVREAPKASTEPVVAIEAGPLPRAFWMVLAIWVVFSLGNSSDVFLLLRAKELGLGTTLVVLAYAAYNVVYSGLSWPLGALSDRRRRELVLGGGLLVFGLVYLGFAVAPGSWAVWPLFAVYGAYIAATDGVARAWVADQVPGRAIGTAYGVFAAATGAALLLASVAAGLLWSHVSPAAPFVLGASAAGPAFVLLVLSLARPGRASSPPAAPPPPPASLP